MAISCRWTRGRPLSAADRPKPRQRQGRLPHRPDGQVRERADQPGQRGQRREQKRERPPDEERPQHQVKAAAAGRAPAAPRAEHRLHEPGGDGHRHQQRRQRVAQRPAERRRPAGPARRSPETKSSAKNRLRRSGPDFARDREPCAKPLVCNTRPGLQAGPWLIRCARAAHSGGFAFLARSIRYGTNRSPACGAPGVASSELQFES